MGALSAEFEALSIEALKSTSVEEMVACIVDKLQLPLMIDYELAEVVGNSFGQECKERRLGAHEHPVALMLLWPKLAAGAPPHAAGDTPDGGAPLAPPPSPAIRCVLVCR